MAYMRVFCWHQVRVCLPLDDILLVFIVNIIVPAVFLVHFDANLDLILFFSDCRIHLCAAYNWK